MALRKFLTATLLFAPSTYGAHELGELETLDKEFATPSNLDITALANLDAADDVSGQHGKAEFVGMNICGFDFGCNQKGFCDLSKIDAPLTNVPPAYTDPDDPLNNGTAQMVHFATADNFNVFRLPVSWQYLVNNDLGGPLDPTTFGYYDQLVRGCLSTGAYCMIDLHNYARWDGKRIGEDDGPSVAQFADLWGKVAANYKHDDRVWFGTMNEPYDLPSLPSWKDAVQAAVTAIREAGAATQFISLPGRGHQSPGYLIAKGDGDILKQVTNPDGTVANLVFDVHLYLDADGSGTSRKCVTSGVEANWAPLAEWLRENGRQAIVTETGGGDTPSCEKYLCQQLRYLDDNSDVFLGYVIWAAGSFKSSYELSMTPSVKGEYWKDIPLLTQCVAR
ncbi:cellulase [Diaporthe eres]|uniref:cellulase n=1 Tax=Diaporthe vaccinii TaxID=105482 RepID=A0ABR4EEN6_9PEZI|nr:cellulase [Diaporthe eres]